MAEPTPPDDSILIKTKKALGIEEAYTVYDVDIIMHINSVFSILFQLGVGPTQTFQIEDKNEQWQDFIQNDDFLAMVKSYMYLRVKKLFDKAGTSFAIQADDKEIEEMGFRLSLYCPPASYSSEGS